jgi:hypothetical protein
MVFVLSAQEGASLILHRRRQQRMFRRRQQPMFRRRQHIARLTIPAAAAVVQRAAIIQPGFNNWKDI